MTTTTTKLIDTTDYIHVIVCKNGDIMEYKGENIPGVVIKIGGGRYHEIMFAGDSQIISIAKSKLNDTVTNSWKFALGVDNNMNIDEFMAIIRKIRPALAIKFDETQKLIDDLEQA